MIGREVVTKPGQWGRVGLAFVRTVAVWPHVTRPEANIAAATFVAALTSRGIVCICPRDDIPDLTQAHPGLRIAALEDCGHPIELAVVFGGDGSILRAAEWSLPRQVPLLGVNMGHVGFLAELEYSELGKLVDKVVDADYQIEDRVTLVVRAVNDAGEIFWQSEAVNEVSIEKSARERMLDLLVRIDSRPLARWGCDGVLVATPTGSTAYAFSAGGPVVWPDVEALMIVPISAHALFSRPVVIGPDSEVEVQLVESSQTEGVVWCDGRRTTSLSGGTTLRIRQGNTRLLLARLEEQPFTNRLVKKFGLRVEGWRGAREH